LIPAIRQGGRVAGMLVRLEAPEGLSADRDNLEKVQRSAPRTKLTRLCDVFCFHSQPASSSVIVQALHSNPDPLFTTDPTLICPVLSGRSRSRHKHPLIIFIQQLLLIPHYQSRKTPLHPSVRRHPSQFHPPEAEFHCRRDHDAINTLHV